MTKLMMRGALRSHHYHHDPGQSCLLALLLVSLLALVVVESSMTELEAPHSLKVNGLLPAVAVISDAMPRFSFMHSQLSGMATFGITQASYRITVHKVGSSRAAATGDLHDYNLMWDSGGVNGTNCTQIVYAGRALIAFTRYEWTAQWTASGAFGSSAVATATFETGPMATTDWHGAAWLQGRKTQYRRVFVLPAATEVVWARAYVAALGCAHVEVNGAVPQPDLMGMCPWSVTPNLEADPSASLNVRYVTHNLSRMLKPGAANAIGVVAGSVMQSPQTMVLILVQQANGPPLFFHSGESGWFEASSYVVSNSAWTTTIDWTQREVGWSTVHFKPDSKRWTATNITHRTPSNVARALAMPLSTIVEEIQPTSVQKLSDGDFLYTFPANFVGTIKVSALPFAKDGSKLNLLVGEWLDSSPPDAPVPPPHGCNSTDVCHKTPCRHCGCASGNPPCPPPPPILKSTLSNLTWPTAAGKVQYENHILASGKAGPVTTLFCWHGINFLRVSSIGNTGFRGSISSIVGLSIHTNMSQTGWIQFGGDGRAGSESERAAAVLNGINSMTLQSQRTNVAAYMPTDCPTREKRGWLGDALDASEQGLMNFDMSAVQSAFMQSIKENQSPGDIAWTSAWPRITSMLHDYYGDRTVVETMWPSLVRYAENLIAHSNTGTPEGLSTCDTYQDWLCNKEGFPKVSCCTKVPANSSCPVAKEMGGFSYVKVLQAMQRMAQVLGKPSDRYKKLEATATVDFHTIFWNPALNAYGGDFGATQSLSLPALYIHATPAPLVDTVLTTLQNDITQRTNFTPNVGAVTSKILLNVLSDYGLHETALRVATTTEEPSWGYWWSLGATTCFENWPWTTAGVHGANVTFHPGTQNHIFLCGGIGEWMWKHEVGLTFASPAFATVHIAPKINSKFGPTSASATFISPRGEIRSSWLLHKATGASTISLNVSLPIGVGRAMVLVPKPFDGEGQPVARSIVTLNGRMVWNGKNLVVTDGTNVTGILSASNEPASVRFDVVNGVFAFEATMVQQRQAGGRPLAGQAPTLCPVNRSLGFPPMACPAGRVCRAGPWSKDQFCCLPGPGISGGGCCKRGVPLPPSKTKKNCLLIGDSVTSGMSGKVISMLKDICQTQVYIGLFASEEQPCFHISAGATALGVPIKYDVIHYNEGLHSIYPRVNTSAQLAQWASNLGKFTDLLKSTGAKLIYATMTPYMPEKYVNPNIPGPMNPQDDVEMKNALAVKTVKAHGVAAINDLYSVVTDVCGKIYRNCSICDDESSHHPRGQCGDHYVDAGWELLANSTAQSILALLRSEKL